MTIVYRHLTRFFLILLLLLITRVGSADVGLLMEEPFGTFGYVNPTGHAAIYLSNVCAVSPTELRRCHSGETGVVISRYHHVGGYDWLAIPLIPYLYAVDSVAEIPQKITPEEEARLRDNYRRSHLEQLIPDNPDGQTPGGEWIQLVGASYDRRIYIYEVDAAEERDDAFVERFNAARNSSHFNLFFNNCADLSKAILNFYYPHSIHRNMIADTGFTTPKQVARSLAQYARHHERLDLRTYTLPQVEGSTARSHPINGVIESFLKKKYVVPLAIVQPAIAGGLAVAYLLRGRYNPSKDAETLAADDGLAKLYAQEPVLALGDALGAAITLPGIEPSAAADGLMLVGGTSGTE